MCSNAVKRSPLEEECNGDVLRLECDTPEDFGDCVCFYGYDLAAAYLIIRNVIVLCHFALFVAACMLSSLENLKLWIFFDFWTQLLIFITSQIGMFPIVRRYSNRDIDCEVYWDCTPWYCKLYWALFSAALPSTIMSCIVYWSMLYKSHRQAIHILMNTITPILGLLEFAMCSFPLRLIHVFYFIFFYLLYMMFTVIYFKSGGTGTEGKAYIYESANWKHPKEAAIGFFITFFIGVAVYFILCLISMLKLAWRNRACNY